MSSLDLVRTSVVAPTNAFTDLEGQLRVLDDCGSRIARATRALRSSARLFAQAAVRLERARHRHLRVVR